MSKTQKVSLRLLREGVSPGEAVRDNVDLSFYSEIEGAWIATGRLGGHAPQWANFLQLPLAERNRLISHSPYAIVFLQADGRWFAASFGIGHVKLDQSAFEQNFGLRVVLNSVDPEKLRSTDLRTPDEVTLLRRAQTSRGSDQTSFGIDIDRDLVRGLAGVPQCTSFGTFVAGSDALALSGEFEISHLPDLCTKAYEYYQDDSYKDGFAWVDQVRHVRDNKLIGELDKILAKKLEKSLNGKVSEAIHFAYPEIYDPENVCYIRYKGFRSTSIFSFLDVSDYINAMKERGIAHYAVEDLSKHKACVVDDSGEERGKKWSIRNCIAFEAKHNGKFYILSDGLWYEIHQGLVKQVTDFFENVQKLPSLLPAFNADENEKEYNQRVASLECDKLCLDRALVKPPDASSSIEICDLLSKERQFIHVKIKNHSSSLSHLFMQGLVSAEVLASGPESRKCMDEKINSVQNQSGKTGFDNLIPSSYEDYRKSEFTIVYAVIAPKDAQRLPFFSLVSFRRTVLALRRMNYKIAFAWIEKTSPEPEPDDVSGG